MAGVAAVADSASPLVQATHLSAACSEPNNAWFAGRAQAKGKAEVLKRIAPVARSVSWNVTAVADIVTRTPRTRRRSQLQRRRPNDDTSVDAQPRLYMAQAHGTTPLNCRAPSTWATHVLWLFSCAQLRGAVIAASIADLTGLWSFSLYALEWDP